MTLPEPRGGADILISQGEDIRNQPVIGKETVELYRLFFERNPIPAWVFELNTLKFLAVNEAALRDYGYTREEFLTLTLRDIRPPEEIPALLEYLEDEPEAELSTRVWRHCTNDGRTLYAEVATQMITLGGKPARLSLAKDVTERLRAEDGLRESERRLAHAQRIARLGHWEWNIETGDVVASGEVFKVFGLPSRETSPTIETFLAGVHPDDRTQVQAALDDAIAGTRRYDLDHRVLWPDGTERIVHEQGEVLRDELGRAERMLGTVQDITERQRAAAGLLESEERYRILFEGNPMPMWVSDPETLRWLAVNEAAIHHYGYSRAEFLSMTLDDIRPPEDIPVLHEYFASEPSGLLPDRVWRHLKKDGTLIEVEVTYHPVEIKGRKVRLSLGRDVTEERRTQRLLDEAQRVGQMGSWNFGVLTNQTTWSGELYRIYGVDPDTFTPTLDRVAAMIHVDDRADFLRDREKCMRAAKPYERSHRIVRPNGEIRSVFQRVLVEADSAGKPVRIHGITQDVTDINQAQAQLADAQRLARIGSWSRDLRTRRITWSAELYRILGLPSDTPPDFELLMERIHPDDREAYLRQRTEALRSGDPYQQIIRIVHADGTIRVLRNNVAVEKDAAGEPTRFYGSSQDVTELWEAEKQVRHQASLLDLMHEAIIVRDLKDQISFWSRGAEQLYGWSAEEARGRRSTDFFYEDTAVYLRAKKRLLEVGAWNGELNNLRKDGSAITVGCHWTLVRNARGEPASVIAIHTDLTEQKKLQQQFLRAQRLERIGTLASGVAHDLNNVLVPILMVAPLLRGEISDEDREKFLGIVEMSAQRGANIVKQVLTFARGAEGDHLLLQPTHLLDEIGSILRETFPKNISVLCSYPETVSAIEGDPTQLHQVLLNLAVNARDAMPDGGQLAFSVVNAELDEHYAGIAPGVKPGPYVLIQVRDTGAGIPQHVIDKIFDPFFTTKEIGVGTGLGLSTVLGIVKSHGGFVNVYSKPGETIFKIFLPAAASGTMPAAAQGATAPPLGDGEMILVVDDELGIREIASAVLNRYGYQVVVAEDGPSALALFAASPDKFKVVLTDMVMPFLDGMTLVRTLRKMQPGIKAIISTGREEDCRPEEFKALGIQAYLSKPYTRDQLLEVLHHVLADDAPAENDKV